MIVRIIGTCMHTHEISSQKLGIKIYIEWGKVFETVSEITSSSHVSVRSIDFYLIWQICLCVQTFIFRM